MKTTIKSLTTIALGILISSCSATVAEKKEEKKVQLLPLVSVEAAKIETFTHEVKVQGTVETDQNTIIGAEMGGTVTEIKVKEGQFVKSGQVLVVIDASVLSANAQEIRTQLEYAEYMLDKQQQLKDRGVGTDFELETAKNQVKALNSKLHSLQTQQGKSLIKAPFDGTIDQVFASKGQIAGPQSPLVRIVNNKEVNIVSMISEKYISKVKEGGKILVSFPNYSDTTIEMTITSVGNYIEPTNRTFRIRSLVKNNDWMLPNMLAEVKVTDQKVENGLVIPNEGILKDGNNEDYIFVITEEKKEQVVVMKKIKVIEQYENKALIVNDGTIKEGDLIVTKGARGVENKDKVRTK